MNYKLAKDVIEFRKANGLPLYWNGTKEELMVGYSVIIEELTELADAKDIVEIADALVDTVYTLVGHMVHKANTTFSYEYTVEHFAIQLMIDVAEGKGIDFLKCWDEVHRSNMSKACKDQAEMDATEAYYSDRGILIYFEEINGLHVAKCLHDENGDIKEGKVLKNVFYSEADLEFVRG